MLQSNWNCGAILTKYSLIYIESWTVWTSILLTYHQWYHERNSYRIFNFPAKNIKNFKRRNSLFSWCAFPQRLEWPFIKSTQLCSSNTIRYPSRPQINPKHHQQIPSIKSQWPSLLIDHIRLWLVTRFLVGVDS